MHTILRLPTGLGSALERFEAVAAELESSDAGGQTPAAEQV